jgi:hypothetical protein
LQDEQQQQQQQQLQLQGTGDAQQQVNQQAFQFTSLSAVQKVGVHNPVPAQWRCCALAMLSLKAFDKPMSL